MGKRSNFERVEKDFYRTIDPRAVAALAPHLPAVVHFAEPCVGEKDLLNQLEALGHLCTYWGDIRMGEDALKTPADSTWLYDLIITNPPWSRPILHALIDYLSALRPTWLLFDADWAHTKQSAPFMSKCVKIVSVGRLIWIPGTTTSGKDNCAWYLFDVRHNGPTQFYGRV